MPLYLDLLYVILDIFISSLLSTNDINITDKEQSTPPIVGFWEWNDMDRVTSESIRQITEETLSNKFSQPAGNIIFDSLYLPIFRSI